MKYTDIANFIDQWHIELALQRLHGKTSAERLAANLALDELGRLWKLWINNQFLTFAK